MHDYYNICTSLNKASARFAPLNDGTSLYFNATYFGELFLENMSGYTIEGHGESKRLELRSILSRVLGSQIKIGRRLWYRLL